MPKLMVLLRIWRRSYHKCSLRIPLQHRLCGRRYDHCHGPQKQPQPLHLEKGLRPYIASRDHCKFGWWHSGSCDGSPAEHRVPKCKISAGWLPHRRYWRLPRTHHSWAYKIQIAHPGSLPIGHDGPHRYGTGTCCTGLWCARSSTRSHHVGPPSIRIQHEKTTAKWKDGPSMRHLRGLAPL